MNTIKIYLLLGLSILFFDSYSQIGDLFKKAKKELLGSDSKSLSNQDISNGLKQALEIGVKNAVDIASARDGFYKSDKIKIPFPPSAKKVEDALRSLGMGEKIDKFEESLNRAAEKATAKSMEILIDAVKGITIEDGIRIVNGKDDEATMYLKKNTQSDLKKSFDPIIKDAINQVNVAKYWKDLANLYNKIPFVSKIEPNLNDYVNKKTIDGIFILVAEKEKDIRKNPAERITELLKKIFG